MSKEAEVHAILDSASVDEDTVHLIFSTHLQDHSPMDLHRFLSAINKGGLLIFKTEDEK